jgi:glycerol uptake operon antiterminator
MTYADRKRPLPGEACILEGKIMAAVANPSGLSTAAELDRRRALLAQSPIIAPVPNLTIFQNALDAPVHALYLLMGTPLSFPEIIHETHKREKLCLVNLDFSEGLARDRHAVEFLASHGADGIISTKSEVLRTVGAFGMLSILRTFAIDKAAVAVTLKILTHFIPDAIEILPAAVAPRVIAHIRPEYPGVYIIGGGLIESVREIEGLFEAGVGSITTSDTRLWVI